MTLPKILHLRDYTHARNMQALSLQFSNGVEREYHQAPLQPLGESARLIEAHALERGGMSARRRGGE